jgi:uncharacterized protein
MWEDDEQDEREFGPPDELHRAAEAGDLEKVVALVEQGADVNAFAEEDTYNEIFTPLHCAAKSGSLPVVAFLVRHGADVNAQPEEGEGVRANSSGGG